MVCVSGVCRWCVCGQCVGYMCSLSPFHGLVESIPAKRSYVGSLCIALILFFLAFNQKALPSGAHHMVVTIANHFLSFLELKKEQWIVKVYILLDL